MTTQMKPLTAASSPWVATISVTEGFKVSSLSSKEDWAPALFPRSWPIQSAGGDNSADPRPVRGLASGGGQGAAPA